MQITDILSQMGGLRSVAQELGVSESEAAKGADALIPAILGGLQKQRQEPTSTGSGGLGSLLEQLGGGGLLDDVLGSQPTHVDRGNNILGQIFGSKDVSRTVAQSAASESGLNSDLLKKMLPMLAMLVTGLMAKQGGAGASGQDSSATTEGGLGGLLGGMLGGGAAGGLGSLLDQNKDGNALDDILRMAGKFRR